jgi:hypothetical protein
MQIGNIKKMKKHLSRHTYLQSALVTQNQALQKRHYLHQKKLPKQR